MASLGYGRLTALVTVTYVVADGTVYVEAPTGGSWTIGFTGTRRHDGDDAHEKAEAEGKRKGEAIVRAITKAEKLAGRALSYDEAVAAARTVKGVTV